MSDICQCGGAQRIAELERDADFAERFIEDIYRLRDEQADKWVYVVDLENGKYQADTLVEAIRAGRAAVDLAKRGWRNRGWRNLMMYFGTGQ